MTHAFKGALLSGLVYPGLGQLVLRQYRRGALFIVAASAGVAAIVLQAAQRVTRILDHLAATGAMPDPSQILLLVHQSGTPREALIYRLSLLVLTSAWIFSMLDAYLIGRNLDRTGPR